MSKGSKTKSEIHKTIGEMSTVKEGNFRPLVLGLAGNTAMSIFYPGFSMMSRHEPVFFLRCCVKGSLLFRLHQVGTELLRLFKQNF